MQDTSHEGGLEAGPSASRQDERAEESEAAPEVASVAEQAGGEARAGQAKARPAAPRHSMAHMLESPVLLPSMPMVEPSPSTSLMSYPIPLFHPKSRQPVPPGTEAAAAAAAEAEEGSGGDGGAGGSVFYPWAYPSNFIAPSRNRQAAARAAAHGPDKPEKPRRESAANDDGYNWRKYGEKQVKGSPYPRSYYKCSYPGCTVKKIIERDPRTGHVSEAVAKGSHNHPKPGQVRGHGAAARERIAARQPLAPPPPRPSSGMADAREMQDNAVAALQLLGTGYSPQVHGLPPAEQDTPSLSLLPIPPSLRTSAEPDDRRLSALQALVMNGLALGGSSAVPVAAAAAGGAREDSELTEADFDSEVFDSGDDDDDWEPAEAEFCMEPASTAEAAEAAAAAAARGRGPFSRQRARHEGVIMTGKRRRGRHRTQQGSDEELEELYGSDDELRVLRNMSNGYKQEDGGEAEAAEPALPPKRRRGPSAGASSPALADGEAPERPTRRGGGGGSGGGEGGAYERNVVEMETDADNIDDGYRWRKYGQKIVKGNPHPRSYYKCTHPACNVRKQVERSGKDARRLVTTYEGTHSHDAPQPATALRPAPARRNSLAARRQEGSAAGKARPAADAAPSSAAMLMPGGMPQLQALQQMAAAGQMPLLMAQSGGSGGGMQVTMPGLQASSVAAALAANHALAAAARQSMGAGGGQQTSVPALQLAMAAAMQQNAAALQSAAQQGGGGQQHAAGSLALQFSPATQQQLQQLQRQHAATSPQPAALPASLPSSPSVPAADAPLAQLEAQQVVQLPQQVLAVGGSAGMQQ